MSKINGDKKRDHVRARRQTKMREKMRAIRATMNLEKMNPEKPAAAPAAEKPAAAKKPA